MDADQTRTLLRDVVGSPAAPDLPAMWRIGRRRRTIRRLGPVVTLALVGLGGALMFALTDDGTPTELVTAGPRQRQHRPTSRPPVTQPAGAEPVEWRIDPQHPPSAKATRFVAVVRQSGCPPPLASELNEPTVVVRSEEIAVGFTSAPSDSPLLCAEVRTTKYVVHLARPLGQRRLVDGTCRPVLGQCSMPPAERWPKHEPSFSSPSPQPLLFASVRVRTSGPCIRGGRGAGFVRPGPRGRLCYRLGTPTLRVRVERAHAAAGATLQSWKIVVPVGADARSDLVKQFACPANAVCLRRWIAVLVDEEVVTTLTMANLDRPTLTLGPFQRGIAEGLALTLTG